jgi:hypothetical protein
MSFNWKKKPRATDILNNLDEQSKSQEQADLRFTNKNVLVSLLYIHKRDQQLKVLSYQQMTE